MIIYKDVISDDEVLSSAFEFKEIDGVVYEADCAMITLGADNIDTGANASAEEADEALDDGAKTVNNFIHSFRLQATTFDKKGYLTYLKGYMKAIKGHLAQKNPDSVSAFETGAQAFAKKIVANFKDYEFYTGESMNPDGMILLLNYREDGTTPFFTIWKHGLSEMKV